MDSETSQTTSASISIDAPQTARSYYPTASREKLSIHFSWKKEMDDLREVLPFDVIRECILPRVGAKDLLKFRRVCKSWNELIRDPRFVCNHLNLHRRAAADMHVELPPTSFTFKNTKDQGKIEYGSRCRCFQIVSSSSVDFVDVHRTLLQEDETAGIIKRSVKIRNIDPFSRYKILPPCKGLVVIAHDAATPIYLFNPSTQEFTTLLKPRDVCFKFTISYGFGFDPIKSEFKLLRICPTGKASISSDPSLSIFEHEILTLGKESSWKSLGFVPERFLMPTHKAAQAVHSNGRLHWKGSIDDDENEEESGPVIVAFHLGKEAFEHKPWPECVERGCPEWCSLHEFDGCLAIFAMKSCNLSLMNVCVLRDYESNSWRKEHCISFESIEGVLGSAKPLGVWKEDEILIHRGEDESLTIYNTKSKTFREISVVGLDDNVRRSRAYGDQVFVYKENPATALFVSAVAEVINQ